MQVIHLGIDDTDSVKGHCTTYLAALIVEELLEQGARFIDYPNLIRLNPNIPWKTRGNAAVALHFQLESPQSAFEIAKNLLTRNSDAKDGLSDPGIAMHVGEIPSDVVRFSKRALITVLSRHEAEKLIKRHQMQCYAEGSKRGLIGAVAAIGNTLRNDHTFEIIAYRDENHNGPRLVKKESVIKMDERFSEFTYNNYDVSVDRVLICPHGPDPVLCGVRGEEPRVLVKALSSLEIEEPVERYIIFRSNQGTAEHLAHPIQYRAYSAGFVRGKVADSPKIQIGGHAFFNVFDGKQTMKCACYEPAGDLRKVVLALIAGDVVEVGGGVRKASRTHPAVLNIEYLKVVKLAQKKIQQNPLCPNCNVRMKSEGKGQGFACPNCEAYAKKKVSRILPRGIMEGLYLPPLHSQRHLTKPLKRYGKEKNYKAGLVDGWCRIYEPEIARMW
jgi:tRNA(Ile2)-agmatinylcytidine synthase